MKVLLRDMAQIEVTLKNKAVKEKPACSKNLKIVNHTKYIRRLSAATKAW